MKEINFIKIVSEYNNCVGTPFSDYVSVNKLLDIDVGLNAREIRYNLETINGVSGFFPFLEDSYRSNSSAWVNTLP